ncbi:MAG: hypothetical protein ACKOU7_05610 [Ferruginibacter sp.]
MKYIKLLLFITIISSCKSRSASELISGTWIESKPKDSVAKKLIFVNDKLAIFKSARNENDSMAYELTDGGKGLKTLDRGGNTTAVDIYKLSSTELVLVRGRDTLSLKKE